MSAAALLDQPSAVASTPDAILGTYKRQPAMFVRGEGVRLFDDTGKSYLDLVAGIAVMSLGHGDAGVAQVIHEALATGLVHTSNLYRTAPGERLAAWLVAHSFAATCSSATPARKPTKARSSSRGGGRVRRVMPDKSEHRGAARRISRTVAGHTRGDRSAELPATVPSAHAGRARSSSGISTNCVRCSIRKPSRP